MKIAVDLLVTAYENTCERVYLVSSDTDLIPAIAKAQEKGILLCMLVSHTRSAEP